MQGLVFDPRPHRLVLPGAARLISPAAALRVGSPLGLREVGSPTPPGPGWALVRPRWTGICGSDLAQAGLQAAFDNPLSGLVSFPHVMGHEVVAEVCQAAADGGPPAGSLVAVDPWLGCPVRDDGRTCPACAAGLPALCERAGAPLDGRGGGMHLGNVAGLPGGFGELMTVHRRRLHPLPPGLDAPAAVLADPLAVALHAVERAAISEGPVLVLGAGTIGLCVTAVLRLRHPSVAVLTTAAWPHLAAEVRALGAEPLPTDPAAAVDRLAAITGGDLRQPWHGPPWLITGGVEAAVDTVGKAVTMETALRALRPRGRVVVVGVARPRRAETTLAYYKEAAVVGSNGYGRTDDGGDAIPAALDLLAAGRIPYGRWLTHRLPLSRWREGFATAMRPGRTRAIKVTLVPDDGGAAR